LAAWVVWVKGARKKRRKRGAKVVKICKNLTKVRKSAQFFVKSMQKFDIFVF